MNLSKLLDFGFIAFIFLGFTVAWMILGAVNQGRTDDQTGLLLKRVQNAYGGPLVITPPRIYYEVVKEQTGKVAGFDTMARTGSFKDIRARSPRFVGIVAEKSRVCRCSGTASII